MKERKKEKIEKEERTVNKKYDVSTLSCMKFHEKQLLFEKFFIKPSSSQNKRKKWWTGEVRHIDKHTDKKERKNQARPSAG